MKAMANRHSIELAYMRFQSNNSSNLSYFMPMNFSPSEVLSLMYIYFYITSGCGFLEHVSQGSSLSRAM